jgi:signal transduction histidine kinase
MRRVVAAQELERARLARELHDETGQALTSILLGLKGVEQEIATEEARAALASVRDTVATTLQGVRRLAVELRPSTLDDFGLVPALERLAATLGEQTGLHVDFEASIDDERFSPEVETTLYRIVQEALTNVVKHAAATRVSILVVRRGDSVAAVVEDDGRGIEQPVHDEGLGLVGMRERAALVGGRVRIESSSEGGTTIAAEVPVR